MYKSILYYLKQNKKVSISFYLVSIVLWFLMIVTPYVVGEYVDLISKKIIFSKIINIFFLFFVIGSLSILLNYIKSICYIKIKNTISYQLFFSIYSHILILPRKVYINFDANYINSRISSDSGKVVDFVIGETLDFILNILTFVFGILFLFYLFSYFAILVVILFPIYYLIYFSTRNKIYTKNEEYIERYNLFYSVKGHELENIDLINTKAWREHSTNYLKNSFDSFLNSLMQLLDFQLKIDSLGNFIRIIVTIIVFSISAIMISKNKMSIGDFTVVNTYISMLLGCHINFLNYFKVKSEVEVSYNRLMEFKNMDVNMEGYIHIEKVNSIETINLSYSYEENYVLEGVSSRFEKGNIYAITGSNGKGKSTFLRILSGLQNDFEGKVLINGESIKNINMYNLRQNLLSFVVQNPDAYLNSMEKNISLDKNLNYCDIDIFDLHNFLSTIFEKDNILSTGQLQKVAIIQSLLKNSEIIIMDEPSSSLDLKSTEELGEFLSSIKKDKIIIIVTHDSRLLNTCDIKINI